MTRKKKWLVKLQRKLFLLLKFKIGIPENGHSLMNVPLSIKKKEFCAMAKGFGSRGIPGMGGGMNMNMIKQAQKMQQDMLKMQQELQEKEYQAAAGGGVVSATVNGKLTALDRLLAFLGWEDCRVKHLRVQRQLFRDSARELSREEYARLVETARRLGRGRLSLLMETICATGIRVSEVRYITAEAVREGRTEIALKGKIRTILLPGKLCRKLEKYARQKKITSGELFLTRSGRPMSRKQIWAEMKGVCRAAGVAPSKVFPHNLRHLFARCFYRVSRDVAKLADVLGHSSIETTRIYLISTGAEHARTLDQLRLIS